MLTKNQVLVATNENAESIYGEAELQLNIKEIPVKRP